MWSSSRKRSALAAAVKASCGLLATVTAGAAGAAEYFAQPMFEAGGKFHTNRGLQLDEAGTEDVAGLELIAAAVLGVVGPTGKTLVRPRARLQRFQGENNLDNTDYSIDLRTMYHSPRHEVELVGDVFRRDALSTEFIEPGFDEFDPNDPTVTDPGRIRVDNTLTRVQLRPTYDYQLTERTRIGVNAIGQTVRFAQKGQTSRVDYNYWSGGVSWEFLATERTTLFVDPYVSHYETLDTDYTADSAGAAFGFDYAWSHTSHFGITLAAEQDQIERIPTQDTPTGPIALPMVKEDSTNYSGLATLVRKGELDQLQLTAGRIISPSTRGTKVNADTFNAQWRHLLTERLDLVTSARYVRERSIGELKDANDDRTHYSAEVMMSWRITPRWYVHGRVEYLVQNYETDPTTANDLNLFLGVGYKGLGSQTESTD